MTDHIRQMFLLPDAWRSPEGGSPLADRKGRALRKVQEQGSAGVQRQSLAGMQGQRPAGSKAEPGGSRAKPGRVTDEMPCPSR